MRELFRECECPDLELTMDIYLHRRRRDIHVNTKIPKSNKNAMERMIATTFEPGGFLTIPEMAKILSEKYKYWDLHVFQVGWQTAHESIFIAIVKSGFRALDVDHWDVRKKN